MSFGIRMVTRGSDKENQECTLKLQDRIEDILSG